MTVPNDRRKSHLNHVSRRSFIRDAVTGATGAALIFPGNRATGAASDSELFRITLDGLFINYRGIPPGTRGDYSWKYRKNYSLSFRLRPAEPSQLRLKAGIPEDVPGLPFEQFQSTQFQDGITLKRRDKVSFSVGYSTRVAYEDADVTVAVKPTFELRGNPESLDYRLVGFETLLGTSFDILFPSVRPFGERTVESWRNQFITEPARITEPRFGFRGFLHVPAEIEEPFTLTESASSHTIRPSKGKTFATIIDQRGAVSDELKNIFAVGKDIKVEFGATQEYLNQLHTVTTSIYRTSPAVYYVYWDYLYKAFLFIDAAAAGGAKS